jgi:hypothetical protein
MTVEKNSYDRFLNNGTDSQKPSKTYETQVFEKYYLSVKNQEDNKNLAAEMANTFSFATRMTVFESDGGESFFIWETIEKGRVAVLGGRTADMGSIVDSAIDRGH